MSQQSGTPQVIGSAITVATTAALGLLDPTYLTPGTEVYNLQTASSWTLSVSTAAITSGVIAVLGVNGMRWIDQGGVSGFVTDAALASTTVTSGATMIGVNNPAARYDQASLQAILDSDVIVRVDLAAADGTGGTALVAAQNTGGYYGATHGLEAFLQAGGAKDAAQDAVIASLQTDNANFFKGFVGSKFGTTPFSFAFDDFSDNVIGLRWATNGTPALDGTFSGGNVKFSVDADLVFKSGQTFVKTPRTKKWAVGGRARFDSFAALNSGEGRFWALRQDGSNYVAIGFFQAQSTTKFSAKTVVGGVTKFAASTVSVETANSHTFVLWWDGTTMFLSVDGETPVSITSTATDMFSSSLFERHGVEVPSAAFYMDCAFAAVQNT